MTSEKTKGSGRRKRTAGIVAMMLMFLLMVSSTFAWFHMSSALNEFDNRADKSVVLHDDFDKDQTDQDGYEAGNTVYNKDVYVENTGTTELYIRIRLDEYMELDGSSVVSGADKADKATWTTHKYTRTDEADCEEIFHDYWEWDMGGNLSEYTPARFSQQNKTADRYEGGTDNLVKGDAGNKSTLVGNLMFMKDYLQLADSDKETYTGWILDTDGYAYWSQKLLAGQATGLLLDAVTLVATREDINYYAINVVMEALDDKDLGAWLTGGTPTEPLTSDDNHPLDKATEEASDFLEWLAGRDGSNDGIVTGEDGRKYKRRPDLGPGKGDIYEGMDDNGNPLDPERIIDSGEDNRPGTNDDEEWTKITDDMNKEEPPASDYDDNGDGYLTLGEKEKWEKATEEEKERKNNTLADISIHTQPAKTVYTEGESFDPSGMELLLTYESGRTDVTDSGFIWEPQGALTETSAVIKISYTENGVTKTAELTITVGPWTLSGIEITSQPVKTAYAFGESFDPAGMVVTGTWTGADGQSTKSEEIKGYAISPQQLGLAENQSKVSMMTQLLTVSYESLHDMVEVQVTNCVESLSLDTADVEAEFEEGSVFQSDNLKAEAVLTSGYQLSLTESDLEITSPDLSTIGNKTVTVTYAGAEARYIVSVFRWELNRIAVTEQPAKKTYNYGDTFDRAGMEVTAYYTRYNGSTQGSPLRAALDFLQRAGSSDTEAVLGTNDYTVNPATLGESAYATDFTTRNQMLTVEYGGVTTEVTVSVANPVTGITLSGTMKTEFETGDSFTHSGLIVTARFTSGSSMNVTGFAVSTPDLSTAGHKTITVSYEGKTAIYSILVMETDNRTKEQREIDDANEFDVVEIGGYEWLVLKKDEEMGTAELLSRECVDTRQYHNSTSNWKWSISDIYIWLNGTFYNGSIGQELRDILVETTKETNLPGNGIDINGDPTTSNIYLLSSTEYGEYATKYGFIAMGACEGTTASGWWLRTPRPNTSYGTAYAYRVDRESGTVTSITQTLHSVTTFYGIRPACTVSYK